MTLFARAATLTNYLDVARQWYERAADLGNASAMFYLGHMYANGRGVEKDMAKARTYWQQAASSGDVAAQ